MMNRVEILKIAEKFGFPHELIASAADMAVEQCICVIALKDTQMANELAEVARAEGFKV